MPRLQSFHERLLEVYGAGRVVNVFKDTGMEARALQLDIGAWVVRNAISDEQAASWHQALTGSLVDIANAKGPRSVELKGSTKRLWYRTIQMTTGFCTCKYGYEGTGRNPVFKVNEVSPFQSVHFIGSLISFSKATSANSLAICFIFFELISIKEEILSG